MPYTRFDNNPQDHDITQAKALLADVKKSIVLADKAYYPQDICEFLFEKNCKVMIPSRSNEKTNTMWIKKFAKNDI